MFGRREPQLTGLDVLIGMADQLDKAGVPYGNQYSALIEHMMPMPGPPIFAGQAIARGDLHEHEMPPVGVVRAAAEWAAERKDVQALSEIAYWGTRAATVWPRFLLSTPIGHPELRYREADADLREAATAAVARVIEAGEADGAASFLEALEREGFVVRRANG